MKKIKFNVPIICRAFGGAVMLMACSTKAQNLYVSDSGQFANSGNIADIGYIYTYTPGGVQSTFASGLGNYGATDMAFDSTGNLFVADRGNGTIG